LLRGWQMLSGDIELIKLMQTSPRHSSALLPSSSSGDRGARSCQPRQHLESDRGLGLGTHHLMSVRPSFLGQIWSSRLPSSVPSPWASSGICSTTLVRI
jgi:hypothetical protein